MVIISLWSGEEMSVLERSMTSDYEAKLAMKREEVAQLLREREELKATHSRLLALQKKMHFRQVGAWCLQKTLYSCLH